MARSIELHNQQEKFDSARMADVIEKVSDVLATLELRLSSPPPRSPFPKFAISESTLKLALLVALAVAAGGLTREGLSNLITLAAHAMGWAR